MSPEVVLLFAWSEFVGVVRLLVLAVADADVLGFVLHDELWAVVS